MKAVTHDQTMVATTTHQGVEDPPSRLERRAELARVTAGCEGTTAGSIHRLMLEQVAHLIPADEWRHMLAWAEIYTDLWGSLPSADGGLDS